MSQLNSVLPQIASSCTDMWEHFPTLRHLASQCESVVEMGVRGGCSAYALAAGLEMSKAKEKWMIYVDINPCKNAKLEELCEQAGINISFHQTDSRLIEIPPTDLLFIDTLHTYGQLTTELGMHQGNAKKYIVCHDTEAPWGYRNEADDGSPNLGLKQAIEDFLEVYKDKWQQYAHYPNCHGLTVLARI